MSVHLRHAPPTADVAQPHTSSHAATSFHRRTWERERHRHMRRKGHGLMAAIANFVGLARSNVSACSIGAKNASCLRVVVARVCCLEGGGCALTMILTLPFPHVVCPSRQHGLSVGRVRKNSDAHDREANRISHRCTKGTTTDNVMPVLAVENAVVWVAMETWWHVLSSRSVPRAQRCTGVPSSLTLLSR